MTRVSNGHDQEGNSLVEWPIQNPLRYIALTPISPFQIFLSLYLVVNRFSRHKLFRLSAPLQPGQRLVDDRYLSGGLRSPSSEGILHGTWEYLYGTGKYEGIKGAGIYVSRVTGRTLVRGVGRRGGVAQREDPSDRSFSG